MRNLYCPRDETELAYLRALLEGEEIEHFVHNDHFGTLNVRTEVLYSEAGEIFRRPRRIV